MINEVGFDQLEGRMQRGAKGRLAHNRGKLAGALLAKSCGAKRVQQGANLFEVNGKPFRIHTISSGKYHFSVNVETEPEIAIIAIEDKPTTYLLYGVTTGDFKTKGVRSPKSGRYNVSLEHCGSRTRLGVANMPQKYLDAPTVIARFDLMDQIEKLPEDVLDEVIDSATREQIKQFFGSCTESTSGPTETAPALASEETSSAPALSTGGAGSGA
jgi:hypothetical protein